MSRDHAQKSPARSFHVWRRGALQLIDGTFPDYGRVIQAGNDKGSWSTRRIRAGGRSCFDVSSERGRAVKYRSRPAKLMLSVTSQFRQRHCGRSRSSYSADPRYRLQLRYLLDIAGQIRRGSRMLADPAHRPCQDAFQSALCADADAGVSRRRVISVRRPRRSKSGRWPGCAGRRRECIWRMNGWLARVFREPFRHDRRPHPPPHAQ
jgi:hypothetical protein